MASRYLIGKGELLTHPISAPKKLPGEKRHPYTLEENKRVIIPQIEKAAQEAFQIPDAACLDDVAVVQMALHPAYLARSWFPTNLLREARLVSVGSKTVRIKPRRTLRAKSPAAVDTTLLLVAGQRRALSDFSNVARELQPDSAPGQQFAEIESYDLMSAAARIAPKSEAKAQVFEVGLHIWPGADIEVLRRHFRQYARHCGFEPRNDMEFLTGRMLFVPVEGEEDRLSELAQYTLMRVVRQMPKLRGIPMQTRAHSPQATIKVPAVAPFSSEPRVAVLDGGLPADHPLRGFVNRYFESDPSAADVDAFLDHGLAVTSALLFGPLEPGVTAPRPYAYVDHHRVLDAKSPKEDRYELYRTLGHIEEILLSRQYHFINLSLGPELPVEDKDVHAWTAVLDGHLASGETLLTVAAGNNGDADRGRRLDRIQVPSDCVNAIAVGASSHSTDQWNRASYSARGPGRQPGRRKPDLLSFGGSPKEYFHVASRETKGAVVPVMGTSFAAPNALRTAIGIRSILGGEIYPLTIRALLIHASEPHTNPSVEDHGWGRITGDINSMITCGDGAARILYQGSLRPGKFLRAPIPLPNYAISGKVSIRATFCYASSVDPQDAAAYTKSGLVITFRPHSGKKAPGATNASSKTFFPSAEYKTEAELRDDLGKWETVLHAENTYFGSSLDAPVFDVHHLARDGGEAPSGAEPIPYALVITIQAKKHPSVYEDILAAHTVLQPIQPTVPVTIIT